VIYRGSGQARLETDVYRAYHAVYRIREAAIKGGDEGMETDLDSMLCWLSALQKELLERNPGARIRRLSTYDAGSR
jgi:hypothetical protein